MFYVILGKDTEGKLVKWDDMIKIDPRIASPGHYVNPEYLNLPIHKANTETGFDESGFATINDLNAFLNAEKRGFDCWVGIKKNGRKSGELWIFYVKASDLFVAKSQEDLDNWRWNRTPKIYSEKYGDYIVGVPQDVDEYGNPCDWIFEP